MQKLNITKCIATDKKKDGTQIINKFGKVSWRVGIQTDKYGEEWINGFLNFNPQWEGTEQELDIYEEEFNGRMSKKFRLPNKEDAIKAELSEIKNLLYRILDNVEPKVEDVKDYE